ncbi:hypothetical protein A3I53_03750 [Candidatus Curtissbacteria bacterium RIFCSPLOWO2_02_FULL_40_13b]|uniref:Uncharacterized protein n=2 Tax=Candidatus Curtissiibacteriota TaxID=1752717 RepID=A0A1F5HUZ8_9BACT|nr:MAG: hypothetical protein A2693_01175 [Candidatus Curtissbacteria bacterium RIFCSPHIGHO2_01_FULL_40_12]OGE08002.1 MAG: hypothetical protein A3I53_03750 [Candidatus Curtissbacteria bacterium RIFCSPLOWO2_02_FULL_40_13b]
MTDRDNGDCGIHVQETRIGVYSVLTRKATDLTDAIRNRLGFSDQDTYLEIHVPDVIEDDGQRRILETFIEGFRNLAAFLEERGLRPRALVGVTHAGVAVWAGRYLNFDLTKGIKESELDDETLERINEGFAKTERAARGKERGPIYLCVQTFESFMQEFGSQGPQLAS